MDSEAVTNVSVFLVLAAIPFVFLIATSFTKISVVLSLLRSALGTAQVPSGSIIAALAVLLSLYVMTPVGEEILATASAPAARIDLSRPLAGKSLNALVDTYNAGKGPLVRFLVRNSEERDRDLFADLARRSRGDTDVSPEDFLVVLPAFLVTELGEAFLIGFLLFVPFLVVDLVVSNVLLSLGMHMLSPTTISLPLKLLLFVAVDGWYLLTESLVTGYA